MLSYLLPILTYGCVLDAEIRSCARKFENNFCNGEGYKTAYRCVNENRLDLDYKCILDDKGELLVEIPKTEKPFLLTSENVTDFGNTTAKTVEIVIGTTHLLPELAPENVNLDENGHIIVTATFGSHPVIKRLPTGGEEYENFGDNFKISCSISKDAPSIAFLKLAENATKSTTPSLVDSTNSTTPTETTTKQTTVKTTTHITTTHTTTTTPSSAASTSFAFVLLAVILFH
jgi:hypothetical protein